jgi:hypothetical protein
VAQFDFEFDFDQWRTLAEKDPAAFFAARSTLLAEFIASAPPRMRGELEALQTMVDHSRVEAGTPDKATACIMGMMADHLSALATQMADLQTQSRELAALLPRSGA